MTSDPFKFINRVVPLTLSLLSLTVAGQDRIVIPRETGVVKPIPISLEGYSGEVQSTLKFDLEVQGFEVTDPATAQYLVKGNNSSSLVGGVTDRINKAAIIPPKRYEGGTPRLQAHTFADEIVEKITGRKGIGRTKMIFKVERGQNSELYRADFDGYNEIQLTRDNTTSRDPAWVPGRQMLYYTSYIKGNPDIYSYDLETGARKPFARFPGLNSGAAVSSDGRRVAMILSKGGSPDIYVMNSDGSNLKQLTRTKEAESSPCWSPDGRTICFSSRSQGQAGLFLVAAEGGPMRRLQTIDAGKCTEPDWSPDGKQIAFTRLAGNFEICVVPAGGGRAEVLVAGEDPSWAPNSRTLVFTRRVGEKRVLSLLDVPTKRWKDARQLSGSCSQPAWAR
jgi:TolB protein